MDPLTLAVEQFHAALALALSDQAPAPQATRGYALEGFTPSEVLKTFRLFEYREDNRYPFILLSADFLEPESYLLEAFMQLGGDEAAIRQGLAEDGRIIAPTPLPEQRAVESLASFLSQLASAVAHELAGLVVVLAPARVLQAEAFAQFTAKLVARACYPELIFLVPKEVAPAGKAISAKVDRKALTEHLKQLKSPQNVGPARENAPQLTAAQRRELTRKTGKRITSKEAGQTYKRLLFEAGEAQSEGQFDLAAKKFRMARTWCHMIDLKPEAVACTIAVGSSHFACGRTERAIEAFTTARKAAAALAEPRLVLQAELGLAATHLHRKEFPTARAAYERITASSDDLPPMKLESLRLRGECFLAENRPGDAVSVWSEALAVAEALDPRLAALTCYSLIGERLQATQLLLGKPHLAAEANDRTARIRAAIHAAPSQRVSQ